MLHPEYVVVCDQVLKTKVEYSFNILNPEGTTCHIIHKVVGVDYSHWIREQHLCAYDIEGCIDQSFLWVEKDPIVVENLLEVLTHRLHFSSETLQEGRSHKNQAV